jgi:hypothetical protein
MKALLVAMASIVALGCACKGREAEPSGVGQWTFTSSKLSDVRHGDCQPTKLMDGRQATWCFAQTPYKIGKRVAEVDLYFLGSEPDSKLIEIQLKVRGCVEDELDQWMRAAMGVPIESKGTRAYWKNGFMWAAALMPSEPGRCVVHFIPLDENAEIERLKQI